MDKRGCGRDDLKNVHALIRSSQSTQSHMPAHTVDGEIYWLTVVSQEKAECTASNIQRGWYVQRRTLHAERERILSTAQAMIFFLLWVALMNQSSVKLSLGSPRKSSNTKGSSWNGSRECTEACL